MIVLEILKRTPLWVFALFFALVALGLRQTRPRTARLQRLVVFPLVLMGLALYGVLSAYNAHPIAIAAWLAVLLLMAAITSALKFPRGVSYAADTGRFSIPGSWAPFAFIMVIFFTRYAIAVSLARNPALRDADWFAACVGAAYGFSGGYFAGRILTLWRLSRATSPLSPPGV